MAYDFLTSGEAYKEAKQNISTKRQQVFSAIRRLGKCTDRQIADTLGWSINSVTPRRLELVESNLVTMVGRNKDVKTNRTVKYYEITKLEPCAAQ